MSTYGISLYGTPTKYGGSGYVEFDVSPFSATPLDYGAVALTWTSPSGTWQRIRVLRNRFGWAVTENDGEILLDSVGAVDNYLDLNVVPGRWLYYTVFIQNGSGVWSRAGTASTLMTKDYGYAQRMFDLLPLYHRMIPGEIIGDFTLENNVLKAYIASLAITLDYVKTYYDLLRYVNDPMQNNFGDLVHLAAQFGIPFEASTPARLFRQRVANAGYLGRQKGTIEGMRNVINLTTGWDVDIELGPNLMLNEDQASFVHPVYPTWDATVNYPIGSRAVYQGFLYTANSGGAYGAAQAPTGLATSNTWWTWSNGVLDSTQNLLGWEALSFTGGITPTQPQVAIGVGFQSEVDPSVSSANTLMVQNVNAGATTATLGVRSVSKLGLGTLDPVQPIKTGVPVPYVTTLYDATVQYYKGQIVSYHGRQVRALVDSKGVLPSAAPSSNGTWEPIGFDDRAYLMLSLYARGVAGSYVNGYPFLEWYDQYGVLITALYSDVLPAWQIFDSFTSTWGTIVGRVTDVGGLTWSQPLGVWLVGANDGGVAYPTTAVQSVATVTRPSSADSSISVTFDTVATGVAEQGLALRYNADKSHLLASRTRLVSVATTGVKTLIGTYSSAFNNGDRMKVVMSGTSITVYKNGVSVLAATSAINQTSTIHGLAVE